MENWVKYRELFVGFGYKRTQLKKNQQKLEIASVDNINAKKWENENELWIKVGNAKKVKEKKNSKKKNLIY